MNKKTLLKWSAIAGVLMATGIAVAFACSADIKANGSDGPITIPYNTSANLTWTSIDATACTVTPGNFTGTSGSHSTGNLTASQKYTINCTFSGGSVYDSVTVNVAPAPTCTPNPSADLTGTINSNDTQVTIHNSSALCSYPVGLASYKMYDTNIDDQTLYADRLATIGPNSSITLSVSVPSCAYQIDAFNGSLITSFAGGVRYGTRLVSAAQVTSLPFCTQTVAPTDDIKANGSDGPITINAGTAATLSWTSTNATSCTVTPGNFSGTSGSQSTGNLTASQNYTLSCTGPGGSAFDNVIVMVQTQQITADIKANNSDGPVTINSGGSANLTWTSSGATSCSVNPGGLSGTSGSQSTGALTTSQIYILSCTGPGGSVSDSVIVNVQTQQITADIKVNGSDGPITINSGNPVFLTWTSSGAASCTVSPGGYIGTTGAQGVSFTTSQSYMLTCTGPGGTATDSVTVNVTNTPVTADIKANSSDGPITVNSGSSAALTWTSTGAASCTVSPGGLSGTSGSQSIVAITSSQTYSLACTGPGGTATDSVTVNVQNIPVTASIEANGASGSVTINSGDSAILSWTSTGATSCTVSPGGFSGTSGFQSTGSLNSSQTYVLTCLGSNGQQANDTVTVNVQQNNTPPTVTIQANPNFINQGQNTILTWNSQNATNCYGAGGWSGNQSLSGSQQEYPSFTTTYTIVCTNSSGQQASAQTTVTVNNNNNNQQPTLSLFASPTTINQGQSSVLNWNSQNTTNCSASGGWSGNENLSGSQTVYPAITTTYYLTCSGNGGSVSQQATVFVNSQQIQPIVTLTANPTVVNQGQNSVLSWTSQNANVCSASGGWSGNQNISGSQTVYPTITTTYTISCSNNYGVAQSSQTIIVNGNTITTTGQMITKTVLNRTLGQTTFSNSVNAQSLDVLQFQIVIVNTDNITENITVRDTLPQQLFYVPGSTTVNGATSADGITGAGIVLPSMAPGAQRTIQFRATVFSGTAQGTITNQASATSAQGTQQTGYATVIIASRGQVLGIQSVPTGPENPVPWILFFGFVGSIIFHFAFVEKKLKILNPSVPFARLATAGGSAIAGVRGEYRPDRVAKELEAKLAAIRMEETWWPDDV